MIMQKAKGKNQKLENGFESSRALQELFHLYTHLLIGGKEICCPYWMNLLKRMVYGPYGGKGTPMQIISATEEEARKEGLDLSKMNSDKILSFMRRKKIGVDCSGFVFAMLDVLDREKGGNGLADDIPNCRGKLLCRANVRMLTDEKVVVSVEKVNDIVVGDLIRLDGGKHVAVVIGITRESGRGKEIEYAHSSKKTSLARGVHSDKIMVINPDLNLGAQTWLEKTAENENYGQKYLLTAKRDGIKRLKIWA